MNRRGFSTLTSCQQCGFRLKCARCDVSLTYMYAKAKMVCRHCNFTMDPPRICPNCNKSYLRFSGMGIEKLESEICRYFPQAKVVRYDKETKGFPKDFHV